MTAPERKSSGRRAPGPAVDVGPASIAQTTASRLTGPSTTIDEVASEAAVESWMRSGRCAGLDPATFFPSDGVGVVHAIQICLTCVVQERCLEYALENRISIGVWGGVSERGRRRLRRSTSRPASGAREGDPGGASSSRSVPGQA